jgi:hypothetical protein
MIWAKDYDDKIPVTLSLGRNKFELAERSCFRKRNKHLWI